MSFARRNQQRRNETKQGFRRHSGVHSVKHSSVALLLLWVEVDQWGCPRSALHRRQSQADGAGSAQESIAGLGHPFRLEGLWHVVPHLVGSVTSNRIGLDCVCSIGSVSIDRTESTKRRSERRATQGSNSSHFWMRHGNMLTMSSPPEVSRDTASLGEIGPRPSAGTDAAQSSREQEQKGPPPFPTRKGYNRIG